MEQERIYMGKKLFSVQAMYKVYIMAEDAEDANRILNERVIGVADGGEPNYVRINHVYKDSLIPTEWKDSIPFGDEETEMTCKEIQSKIRML
jgi:hypothetical protein